jgi:ACS family pantothenate transporter-like MFS transporter
MATELGKSSVDIGIATTSPTSDDEQWEVKQPLRLRIREIIWDSWDRSPEERKFISKIDFFIL